MKFKSVLLVLLLLAIGLSACQMTSDRATDCEPQVIVVTSVVEVVVTATPGEAASAAEVAAQPTSQLAAAPAMAVSGDWIQPEDALNRVGEVLSVRLDQAHCSYQANTNGTPTFCNDQAYPDHDFTFVIWGHDWSHYDGACVIVEGEIEVYDGKAQIVVEDAGQVAVCP